MTTPMKQLAQDARVAARPIGGTYRGQVLPTTRRYTDPIVLTECRHLHRTERGARACAEQMCEALRQR